MCSFLQLTADGVTVGMCLILSKILSKIFPADSLKYWPIVYLFFNISHS